MLTSVEPSFFSYQDPTSPKILKSGIFLKRGKESMKSFDDKRHCDMLRQKRRKQERNSGGSRSVQERVRWLVQSRLC